MKSLPAICAFALAVATGAAPAYGAGDVGEGEEIFAARCQACHTVEEGGRDKVGPNLFGMFGAAAGRRAYSFEYRHSPALKQSGIVWSAETLERFLANPGQFIPGNRMPFVGLAKQRDRDDVIAYLKSVTR